jgi:hypothetical protein
MARGTMARNFDVEVEQANVNGPEKIVVHS